jgi:hypothetical protein
MSGCDFAWKMLGIGEVQRSTKNIEVLPHFVGPNHFASEYFESLNEQGGVAMTFSALVLATSLAQSIPTQVGDKKVLAVERFERAWDPLDVSFYNGRNINPFLGKGEPVADCGRQSACLQIRDDNGAGFAGDDTLGFRFESRPASPVAVDLPLSMRFLFNMPAASSGSVLMAGLFYGWAPTYNQYVLARLDNDTFSLGTRDQGPTGMDYRIPIAAWMGVSIGLARAADGGVAAVGTVELDDATAPLYRANFRVPSEQPLSYLFGNFGELDLAFGTQGTSFRGRYRLDEGVIGTGFLPTKVSVTASSDGGVQASGACVPLALSFRTPFTSEPVPPVPGLVNSVRLTVENGALSERSDCRGGGPQADLAVDAPVFLSSSGGTAKVSMEMPVSYLRGPPLEVVFDPQVQNLYGCSCQGAGSSWLQWFWPVSVLCWQRRRRK